MRSTFPETLVEFTAERQSLPVRSECHVPHSATLPIFAALSCIILLHVGFVQAISVLPGQENIELTIEEGKEHSFFLIVNSPARETVTSSSSWIKIEGSESFVLPSGGNVYLLVTVSVPDGTEPGEYSAEINYGTAVLSRIRVTSTISKEDLLKLQSMADVNSQIRSLETSIKSTASSREEAAKFEAEKASLKTQVNDLKAEVSHAQQRSLEAEKAAYTGNIAQSNSPILFVLGLLIGGSGIYLFSRKLHKKDGTDKVGNPRPGRGHAWRDSEKPASSPDRDSRDRKDNTV